MLSLIEVISEMPSEPKYFIGSIKPLSLWDFKSGYFSLILGFFLITTESIVIIPFAIIALCYGIGITIPCLNSLLSKKAKNNQKGLVLGTAYSSQAAARFFGQPLAGLIFLNLGKNYPFYFDIIFLGILSIIYLYYSKKGLN